MMKSLLIKFTSAVVIAVYIMSFIGINVHTCSCSGNVSISLAIHHEDEHGHDHAEQHSHHDCCHDNVYRISVSGDKSNVLHVADLMPMAVPCDFCPLTAQMPQWYEAETSYCPYVSPHPGDILRSICVLRV